MKQIVEFFVQADQQLFVTNDFDRLLNDWDEQHLINIDQWAQFPRRSLVSRYDSSVNLLDEIKQVIDEYYYQRDMRLNESPKRKDSILSHTTVSRV